MAAAIALSVACGPAVFGPAVAGEVTAERLLHAAREPRNWLTHHGSYAAHRFSALEEIHRGNVSRLRLAFTYELADPGQGGIWEHGGLEGTPLAEDGRLYITTGWGRVYKLDVREGRPLLEWRYSARFDRDHIARIACCGVVNRGAALFRGKVFYAALDGKLRALAKAGGREVWAVQLADPAAGETLTGAPLIVKGLAVAGVSGGEFGIRGWIAAVDAETGRERWRTHTVPAPGEPGHETWRDGHGAWKTGGGPAWVTGSYDPELDLIYWGVGNPAPNWDNAYRPGDNLFTDSLVALDPDSGAIRWHYQYTPNDPFDFDGVNEHILIDAATGDTGAGRTVKLAVHADRNGFVYALERTNGRFVWGIPYVDRLNWTRGLDPQSGRPLDYDPALDVQTYSAGAAPRRGAGEAFHCPALMGGKNWFPASYNPGTGLLYIPAIESCGGLLAATTEPRDYRPRHLFTGGVATQPERWTGSLTAVDVATGSIAAKRRYPLPLLGGTLSTAGGLVFFAHGDGAVVAVDAWTLAELWRYETGVGVNAPPISYAAGGKQYIAILAGKGGAMHQWFRGAAPHLANLPGGSTLYVFSL